MGLAYYKISGALTDKLKLFQSIALGDVYL